MIIADVNVFVAAMWPNNVHHPIARAWLSKTLAAEERFGTWEPILASAYRISTTPHVVRHNGGPEAVSTFLSLIRSAPSHHAIMPSAGLWKHFEYLVRFASITGKNSSDALLAALAMDQNATFYTFDKDFDRFPGLRWQMPGA